MRKNNISLLFGPSHYLLIRGGRSCTACITPSWILFIVIVYLESGSAGRPSYYKFLYLTVWVDCGTVIQFNFS